MAGAEGDDVTELYRRGGLSVALIESEADQEVVARLFGEVASEQGWSPGAELTDPGSEGLTLAVWDGGELHGGICLRTPSPDGWLPMLATWPELSACVDPGVAELVLIAVRRERRGGFEALWTLCTEMWRQATRRGLHALLLAVPLQKHRAYQRLGWSLEIVGPIREHWGEPCQPCRIDLKVVEQNLVRLRGRDPSFQVYIEQAHRTGEPEASRAPEKRL